MAGKKRAKRKRGNPTRALPCFYLASLSPALPVPSLLPLAPPPPGPVTPRRASPPLRFASPRLVPSRPDPSRLASLRLVSPRPASPRLASPVPASSPRDGKHTRALSFVLMPTRLHASSVFLVLVFLLPTPTQLRVPDRPSQPCLPPRFLHLLGVFSLAFGLRSRFSLPRSREGTSPRSLFARSSRLVRARARARRPGPLRAAAKI